MARIPEETIQSILDQTDIVDVISSYIPLKGTGGTFKANCPFHNEKTPSFNVNSARQFFYCFGCGEGGSAITFVQKYENMPFVDAVKKLAARAGVQLNEDVYDAEAEKRQRSKSRLIKLHNESAAYFHQLIRSSPDAQIARDYLKMRGFNSESAERWLIGWMPNNTSNYLKWAKEKGYTGRELCDSGICNLKNEKNPRAGIYVNWRNRLIFPINNDYGDIIGFSARQLVDDPNSGKYVNTRETQLFNKSKIFFGLDKARRPISREKCAILCEGQIDVISLHEKGIQNVIAALGTGTTDHHARLLKRYTKNVVLCYDSDAAGHKATTRAFKILVLEGINVRCITMPDGEDPDSYITKNGINSFKELLSSAEEFFDYKLNHATSTIDISIIQNKTTLVSELSELAALVADKVAQEMIILKIATRLRCNDQDVRDLVAKASSKRKFEAKRSRNLATIDTDNDTKVIVSDMDGTVAHLCFLALSSEGALNLLCEQVESLYEPLKEINGGHLLLQILATKPDPNKSSSIQSFLMGLPQADQKALSPSRNFTQKLEDNPTESAQITANTLIRNHLQKSAATIRAALKQPDISIEEMNSLLTKAQKISNLLKENHQ